MEESRDDERGEPEGAHLLLDECPVASASLRKSALLFPANDDGADVHSGSARVGGQG